MVSLVLLGRRNVNGRWELAGQQMFCKGRLRCRSIVFNKSKAYSLFHIYCKTGTDNTPPGAGGLDEGKCDIEYVSWRKGRKLRMRGMYTIVIVHSCEVLLLLWTGKIKYSLNSWRMNDWEFTRQLSRHGLFLVEGRAWRFGDFTTSEGGCQGDSTWVQGLWLLSMEKSVTVELEQTLVAMKTIVFYLEVIQGL